MNKSGDYLARDFDLEKHYFRLNKIKCTFHIKYRGALICHAQRETPQQNYRRPLKKIPITPN